MKHFAIGIIFLLSIIQPAQATTSRQLKSVITLALCERALRVAHDKSEFAQHMYSVYRPRMKVLGLNLGDLGKILGVSGSAVGKMFANDYAPNFIQVLLLIKTLNLTYEEAFPASWYGSETAAAPAVAVAAPEVATTIPVVAQNPQLDAEKYVNVELFHRVYNLLLNSDLEDRLGSTRIDTAIQIAQSLNNDSTVDDQTVIAELVKHLYRLVDLNRAPQIGITSSIKSD